jgi:REP element-mobilizing transposase RayT/DNA-binding NarL/FixJ family response regulator
MMGASSVLVITPSPYMTKKIQQTLIDIGGYKVITSSSPAVALELAQQSKINICILDVFHPEFPVLAVVKELMFRQPDMHLILILTDTSLNHGEIPGIIPDGLLPRSFSTGQLKSALQSIPKEYQIPSSPNLYPSQSNPGLPLLPSPDNSGLQNNTPFSKAVDFSRLNQRLADLSAETTALALLILRRKQLISHSGIFPYAAFQEVVDQINSFSATSSLNLQKEATHGFQKSGSGDMIRFIQLQSIQGKFLLYGISLTKDMQLALIYDQDTPFSTIRRQTVRLTHELLEPQQSQPLAYLPVYNQVNKPEEINPIQPSPAEPFFESPTNQPLDEDSGAQAGIISSVLDSPSPEKMIPSGFTAEQLGTEISEPSAATEPAISNPRIEFNQAEQVKKIVFQDSFELEEENIGAPLDLSQTESKKPDHSDSEFDTHTIASTGSYGHYITYSCLLVPRMPEHMLKSNLASFLFKWMGQLCLAYGWRLEHLSIHPNHIQMVTAAPLATSPAFLVRTLRQKTSQYIFSQFPPLTNENPSGDFWAPGFFISGGKQTIQPHLIDRYINEIRGHQGVNSTPSFK